MSALHPIATEKADIAHDGLGPPGANSGHRLTGLNRFHCNCRKPESSINPVIDRREIPCSKSSLTAALSLFVGICFWVSSAEAELKSEQIKYKVGEREFTGYIVYDDSVSGSRPGIIVVHEWWGHDAYARRRADMLAAEGYTAFALDMYGTGRLADHPKDAGEFAMEVIKTKGAMHSRFRAAHTLLKAHSTVDGSKTAAIGYCFGGSVVLDMVRAGADLNGVVAFHASLTETIPAKPGGVKAKVRVFNGADDPFIKPEKLTAFKEGMKLA